MHHDSVSDMARTATVLPEVRQGGSHWFDNALVYHVVTDRFYRSTPPRPALYERARDACAVGGFHGGDFRGITLKIREAWFTELGVNCLWISAPYEQIQGWVPGGDGTYRHHPYHGYWPLDYTVVEPSFGTAEDLKEMIDAAHAVGIRVVFDIGLSHPGYPDLHTLQAYLPGTTRIDWQAATPEDYSRYFNYEHPEFARWWGKEWVRAEIPGYLPQGQHAYTGQLHGLPRFLLQDKTCVALPAFLIGKVGSKAKALPNATVRDYLVTWLTDWVREYGVDGFRCDSAKHVDMTTWQQLKTAATQALAEWKARHPADAIDTAPFWMTGEVFGQGIEPSSYYEHGFDSLINFQFKDELEAMLPAGLSSHSYTQALASYRLDKLYRRYAERFAGDGRPNVLSYISSHDMGLFDRDRLIAAGTALLLLPGAVQILYGDETGRRQGTGCDSASFCSDMNWDDVDAGVLSHWRRLGAFRARHIAVARGKHRQRSETPYAFSRIHEASGDRVLVVIGAAPDCTLDVADLFVDGTVLTDACSGNAFSVHDGQIRLATTELMLLEPSFSSPSGGKA